MAVTLKGPSRDQFAKCKASNMSHGTISKLQCSGLHFTSAESIQNFFMPPSGLTRHEFA
jgi:hypothetical protein